MFRYPAAASRSIDRNEFTLHQWLRGLAIMGAVCLGLAPASILIAKQQSLDEDVPPLVAFTAPAYPREAKDKRMMGKVVIDIRIGPDGLAARDRIVTGHPVLAAISAEAVRRWRFKPSDKEHALEITFSFEFVQDQCEGTDKHPVTSETYVSAEFPSRIFIRTGLPCTEINNGAGRR